MVNGEEHHFPRRDLAKNGVRKLDAVEIAIAPALERRHDPRVHPLPSSQKLSLTAGGLFHREVLSGRDEPAARSTSTREAGAIVITQLDKRARWVSGSSKAEAEDPRRDREASCHCAHRRAQMLKMLGRRPRVGDAEDEFLRRQRAEELGDIPFFRGQRLPKRCGRSRESHLGRRRLGVGSRATDGVVAVSVSAATSGANTSTANVKLRSSPGFIAPTPTIWRVSSTPRSFVIDTITAYSHASPALGWRMDPSTRRGEKVGTTASPPAAANRRCFRHEGHTLVLCRITARQ